MRAAGRFIDRLLCLFALALIAACMPGDKAGGQKLRDIPIDPRDRWAIDWTDPHLSEYRAEYERQLKKILVFHSYHQGYWWSDTILETIQSELGKKELFAEYFIEYLDTKRQTTHLIFPEVQKLYKLKYADIQFDLILAIDDSALLFLLDYKEDLFPDVPVVFCGIEEIDADSLSGLEDFTGVMERESFTETVELALRFHPSAKQVVLVGDGTPHWLGPWEHDLAYLTEKLKGKIDFVRFSFPELTMDELLGKLRQLDDESIVVLLSMLNPRDKQFYTLEGGAKMIEENCASPIYIFSQRALGSGPVGGNMVDAIQQGLSAAKIAGQILSGENIKDIPILRKSPNKYMFDYVQLKRFGISLSDIPEGSILINAPKSFYFEHRTEILSTTIVFAGLSTIILMMSLNILRRKRAEKKLLDYQGQLKQLASELSMAEEHLRRRIGTRLHDQIGQQLVISKMELDTLSKEASSADIGGALRKVTDSLDSTITELRSLTFDLSSPILYELGLEAALAEWLSENIRQKHGIETEFFDDGRPKPLDEDVRALLFRIAQELLVNVVKHANATNVKLSVNRSNDHIQILVEDNGHGCDPSKMTALPNRTGGFGLFSIKERLEHIGGRLDIDCDPQRGCKITATSPLRATKTGEGEKS